MGRAGCVFISYSAHDLAIATELETILRSASLDVWRDARSIERDWSREISTALAEATAVLLVWSVSSAASRWVQHEWVTARALEKPIVPVLLDNTPLPVALENIQGVIPKAGRVGPRQLTKRLAMAQAAPPAYDFTVVSPGVTIPLAPNPHFVGRAADLLALYLLLIGEFNKLGVRSVGCVGMGGIGKTQLVVEFIHRFAFAFDGVHWIDATDAGEWARRFVALARDELCLTAPVGAGELSDQQWLRLLRDDSNAHRNRLLVMDNVEDPELLAEDASLLGVAPLNLGCNLLFTTRRQFDLPGVHAHSIGILAKAPAFELLTARRPPISGANQSTLAGSARRWATCHSRSSSPPPISPGTATPRTGSIGSCWPTAVSTLWTCSGSAPSALPPATRRRSGGRWTACGGQYETRTPAASSGWLG